MEQVLRDLVSPKYHVALIHPSPILRKKYTLVRLTTDPLAAVARLNPDQDGPRRYELRAYCTFDTISDAVAAHAHLATKKRSFASKERYLRRIAQKNSLPFFCAEATPPGGNLEFLERHAPPEWAAEYSRLVEENKQS
jgi:hypothetical protein